MIREIALKWKLSSVCACIGGCSLYIALIRFFFSLHIFRISLVCCALNRNPNLVFAENSQYKLSLENGFRFQMASMPTFFIFSPITFNEFTFHAFICTAILFEDRDTDKGRWKLIFNMNHRPMLDVFVYCLSPEETTTRKAHFYGNLKKENSNLFFPSFSLFPFFLFFVFFFV